MTPTTFPGVTQDGQVVLGVDKLPWQDGTEVIVTRSQEPKGSIPEILAALAALPPVPDEWVAELEQLIAEGQRPPTTEDPFANFGDIQETA